MMRILLLMLLSFNATAWEQVYTNEWNGATLSGDIYSLIDAAAEGRDVKIRINTSGLDKFYRCENIHHNDDVVVCEVPLTAVSVSVSSAGVASGVIARTSTALFSTNGTERFYGYLGANGAYRNQILYMRMTWFAED